MPALPINKNSYNVNQIIFLTYDILKQTIDYRFTSFMNTNARYYVKINISAQNYRIVMDPRLATFLILWVQAAQSLPAGAYEFI